MSAEERVEKLRNSLELEEKKQKLEEMLESLFDGSNRLKIVELQDGWRRVLAAIPDEDGYAGWLDGAYVGGIARRDEDQGSRYVAEQHFPYRKPMRTYFWEYDTLTGSLTMKKEEGDGSTPGLNLTQEATLRDTHYFFRMIQDFLPGFSFENLEKPSQERYNFQLPQFQVVE